MLIVTRMMKMRFHAVLLFILVSASVMAQQQAPANSILVIKPYRYAGTWVFDDDQVGLKREPLIAGVPKIIDKIVKLPDIKGKIASVDEENNLVVLNVGESQGVRKNFNFTVFRGDKFVAKVNVLQTYADYCAAQVVTQKLPIELGDNAWTRLY